MNPAVIPASATAFLSLEQKTGWSKQSGLPITGQGAVTPSVWNFVQTLPPPIQPPMKMVLQTTGVKGQWADWAAKAPTIQLPKSWTGNFLLRASYLFDSVTGIQAFEVGRRLTNFSGLTDNGQVQLVPIAGGVLECDFVPSSAGGGWKDSGIRFPTFQPGVLYQEELYWTSNVQTGALSLQYISLNGDLQPFPASAQGLAAAKMSPEWALGEAVAMFQCDANPTAIPFNPEVTLSCWAW